jgi:hypothetical protein
LTFLDTPEGSGRLQKFGKLFPANVLQSRIVNVLDFKFNSKARRLAQKLLSAAKLYEPQITQDLTAIAKLINAEIVGLENKFKSSESLERKLKNKSIYSKRPVEKIAKQINDTLRYTYLISENTYTDPSTTLLDYLEGYDYRITKIYNAWELEKTPEDTGYRGINITVISSHNRKFELQLHTKASFDLKNETHILYEEFRNQATPVQRKAEIVDLMLEKVRNLKKPDGI